MGSASTKLELLSALFTRPKGSRLFVLTLLATILVGAGLLLSFVVYVNPWGNYGAVGCFPVNDVHYYNARLAKTERLETLAPAQRPDILVLGSSNTMRFRPAKVEELFGGTCFNFGVFWGMAEDALCIANYVVLDLEHRPELLIVGIDTWTFRGDDETCAHRNLSNTPQLIRQHPDLPTARYLWKRSLELASSQQLSLAWRIVRRGAERRKQLPLGGAGIFAPDGTRILFNDVYGKWSDNIFEHVDRGTYSLTDRLHPFGDRTEFGKIHHFKNYCSPAHSAKRLGYIDQLVELCATHDIRLAFVLNPIHPLFWRVLTEHTDHLDDVTRLRRHFATLERQHGETVVGVLDATQVERFDGDPDGFFDEIHPSTRNSDLMLEHLHAIVEQR